MIEYDRYDVDENGKLVEVETTHLTCFESLKDVEKTFNKPDYPSYLPLGQIGKVLLVKNGDRLLVYRIVKQSFKYEVVLEAESMGAGAKILEETGATTIGVGEY